MKVFRSHSETATGYLQRFLKPAATSKAVPVGVGSGQDIRVGSGPPNVVAVAAEIRYMPAPHSASDAKHPIVELALPVLDGNGTDGAVESWYLDGDVTRVSAEQLCASAGSDICLGYISAAEHGSLHDTVADAYRRLLAFTEHRGYPHLLRIWNFFPAINEASSGLERYREFCVGRHQAFSEKNSDFLPMLPAATAVGTDTGPVQIYFLAATTAGIHIENPRQISAYRYPSTYGPRSPAFARATLHMLGEQQWFYLAGTSSIVGHATQHAGDPYRQAQETLANIDAVIAQTQWQPDLIHVEQLGFKVYVRHPEHLDTIRFAFKDWLGFVPPFRYYQGSICRPDLLLEVEGVIAVTAKS